MSLGSGDAGAGGNDVDGGEEADQPQPQPPLQPQPGQHLTLLKLANAFQYAALIGPDASTLGDFLANEQAALMEYVMRMLALDCAWGRAGLEAAIRKAAADSEV